MSTVKVEHKNGWQIYINSYTVADGDDKIRFIDQINNEIAVWAENVISIRDFRHINIILPYLVKKLNVDSKYPVSAEIIIHDGISSTIFDTLYVP